MLDKRLSDKSLQLELTIGNAGNSLDGQILSTVGRPDAADADSVSDTTVLMNEELGETAQCQLLYDNQIIHVKLIPCMKTDLGVSGRRNWSRHSRAKYFLHLRSFSQTLSHPFLACIVSGDL